MDRKAWGQWKDWKPIALCLLFGVFIPAVICRALFGSWAIESDGEGLLAGALSLAGFGLTIWISNR